MLFKIWSNWPLRSASFGDPEPSFLAFRILFKALILLSVSSKSCLIFLMSRSMSEEEMLFAIVTVECIRGRRRFYFVQLIVLIGELYWTVGVVFGACSVAVETWERRQVLIEKKIDALCLTVSALCKGNCSAVSFVKDESVPHMQRGVQQCCHPRPLHRVDYLHRSLSFSHACSAPAVDTKET